MTVVKISPTKDADAVPAYQLAKDGSIHPLPGQTLTAEERELYGHSGKAAKLGHAGITKERDEFGKLKGYRYGGKFHPSKLYSATAEEPLQPVITEAPQAVGGQPRPGTPQTRAGAAAHARFLKTKAINTQQMSQTRELRQSIDAIDTAALTANQRTVVEKNTAAFVKSQEKLKQERDALSNVANLLFQETQRMNAQARGGGT